MEVIEMEYTIQQLAKLSGVTARTLRYYDEIVLLKPLKLTDTGYRIYGKYEVQLLQQILFYREMGLKLEEIKKIICDSNFDMRNALLAHQRKLLIEKVRIEKMLSNVQKTIQTLEGEYKMTDKERFEGLKDQMIQENEDQYGEEIRKKYGDKVIDSSNGKLRGMTEKQFTDNQNLEKRMIDLLRMAMHKGDIHDVDAQKAVECHTKLLAIIFKRSS